MNKTTPKPNENSLKPVRISIEGSTFIIRAKEISIIQNKTGNYHKVSIRLGRSLAYCLITRPKTAGELRSAK